MGNKPFMLIVVLAGVFALTACNVPIVGVDDAPSSSTSPSASPSTDPSPDPTTDPSPGPATVIVHGGSAGRYLLRGTVVTPGGAFKGEILVVDNVIAAIGASCSSEPQAAGATEIETKGIIFPGMINADAHAPYSCYDMNDCAPMQVYTNHSQWTAMQRYAAMVESERYLNGETSGSPYDLGCEMTKYAKVRALVSGTTSIVSSSNPANRAGYGTFVRTIDQVTNLLPQDKVQVASLMPNASSADGVASNLVSGTTNAYLIHIAEGTDADARGEFDTLNTVTTTDGALYRGETAIVHGTALTDAQFRTMATHGMKLVWCPQSNMNWYNATARIDVARAQGVSVIALATDWTVTGSANLLDELRFAHRVDQQEFGNILSAEELFRMVTINPAKVLGVDVYLGSLETGKRADLFILDGDAAHPYDAFLSATPGSIDLVMVDGRAVYGAWALAGAAPSDTTPEKIVVGNVEKFIHVAEASTADKLGQTYAQIKEALDLAMVAYDSHNFSIYKFSPVAQAF